jgi:AcrR family transcriptional regulator
MDSRERLMEAARRCLVERGHAQCSVKAIAEIAGVNHGLVHHHFGSKEGLFVAAVKREAARHGERLAQAGSREGVRALFLETLADQEFFNLVIEFFALARRMPRVGDAVRAALRGHQESLGAVLGIGDSAQRHRLMATLLGLALWHSLDVEIPARRVAEWVFRELSA